ncbi:MAG: hypothetical protein K8S16_21445 [Bacteroidales bacterium]|nr:hypothetical protein [Bacteroidales bacterium]
MRGEDPCLRILKLWDDSLDDRPGRRIPLLWRPGQSKRRFPTSQVPAHNPTSTWRVLTTAVITEPKDRMV